MADSNSTVLSNRSSAACAAQRPSAQHVNPVTLERDSLARINQALLIGLAAYAELGRVRDEIDFLREHGEKIGCKIPADLRAIGVGDYAVADFAAALHLTAYALDVAG